MSEPVDFTERDAVYSLFLVFAETELIETRASADEAIRLSKELDLVFNELGESHVRVRGAYDLTGFDTAASVMIWLTSETVDDLQWAKRQLHRTQLLGDTLVIDSILALGVSDLEEDARGWVSLAPVAPGLSEDDLDEDFDEDDVGDLDVDNLDVDDLDEDTFVDDADLADDTEDAESEATSLHAQIGIGPIRMYAAVEADDPGELIGQSIGLLDSGLITVATPRTGRNVTPAELYEILR